MQKQILLFVFLLGVTSEANVLPLGRSLGDQHLDHRVRSPPAHGGSDHILGAEFLEKRGSDDLEGE